MSKEKLKISLFPLNKEIQIEKIGSAGDYILFKHLNRNLIDIDANGFIYGDLAETWNIAKDNKTIDIKLRNNIYFSDGSEITSDDVIASILYVKEKGGGIHFDFTNVKKIQKIDRTKVKIFLNRSINRFIRTLAHPEFGVRKKDQIEKGLFDVTSGCYSLGKITEDKVILNQNKNCPNTLNDVKNIEVSFVSPTNQKNSILNNEKDFYISFLKPNDLKSALLSSGKYEVVKPHIGFTYWISINLKSEKFKSLNARRYLLNVFGDNFIVNDIDISIQKAKQLYLPGGPGRLKDNELEAIYKKIKNTRYKFYQKNVSILLPDSFEYNSEILKSLKVVFKEIDVTYYKSQQEFITLNYLQYDLFVNNNDFSSLDLYENLSVTFNPKRPLIFYNKKISKHMNDIKKMDDESLIYDGYRSIGRVLIEDSLIVPLIHKNLIFVKDKKINIDEWSDQYPEISIWKMKIEK